MARKWVNGRPVEVPPEPILQRAGADSATRQRPVGTRGSHRAGAMRHRVRSQAVFRSRRRRGRPAGAVLPVPLAVAWVSSHAGTGDGRTSARNRSPAPRPGKARAAGELRLADRQIHSEGARPMKHSMVDRGPRTHAFASRGNSVRPRRHAGGQNVGRTDGSAAGH